MITDRRRLVTATLTLTTADTQYSLELPLDSADLKMKLLDATKVWRFSSVAGEVAGGGGFPVAAGERIDVDGCFSLQTVYVSPDDNAQVLRYTYTMPSRIPVS